MPNVLSSLVVIATLELARAIVLEATLSFLGLGIQPPTPSWGGMVQEGREYLDSRLVDLDLPRASCSC